MPRLNFIPNVPLVESGPPSIKNFYELTFFIVRKIAMLFAKISYKIGAIKTHNRILSFNEKYVTDLFVRHRLQELLQKKYTSEGGINRTIWTFWLQGIDNAPDLVQKAIKNQQTFAKKFNYSHTILDKDSIFDYIDIPDLIIKRYDEKRLSIAQLTDYIRNKLLRDHGGIWVDATIFLNENFSDEMLKLDNYHAKNTLYLESITGKRARYEYSWTHYPNHFLIAQKNSILYQYMVEAFELYIRKFENRFDYFFSIYLQYLGVRYNNSVKAEEEKIPNNNQSIDLLSLYPLLISKKMTTSDKIFNFSNQNAYKAELSSNLNYESVEGNLFKKLVEMSSKLR